MPCALCLVSSVGGEGGHKTATISQSRCISYHQLSCGPLKLKKTFSNMLLKSNGPIVNEFRVLIRSCLYKNNFAYEHMSSFAIKVLSGMTRSPFYGLSRYYVRVLREFKAATRVNF